ncbi:MAG TPA: ATPase domain-containing protein [Chthoniobacterales bacterium]|nr:ATPase domain-containing protein [Chthoniobacterales bacterium]
MKKKRPLGRGRCATGISGLDDILCGGLPSNRLYLLKGKPGTGKTALALEYRLTGAQNGEKVLYITLSEHERTIREVTLDHGKINVGRALMNFRGIFSGTPAPESTSRSRGSGYESV